MRRFLISVAGGSLLVVLGCRRDDQIQTYRISKDTDPSMPVAAAPMTGTDTPPMREAGGMPPAARTRDIEWTVPKGWKEQPSSSMRVGSFLAKASNGYVADISVVPLSGQAGGDLANINRWRGQINLDPISDAELSHNSETLSLGGRSMLLVDFVSKDLEVDNRSPKRLVAAVYKQGGRTWFFKMTGEDKAVQEIKPAFRQFLKSLRFHDNS